MASAIQTVLGPVDVWQNEIPRDWKVLPQFKGRTQELAPDRLRLYPYIGAFEVYHGDYLLYSKLACRLWPNCKVVADKIKAYFQDRKNKSADLSKYNIKYAHPSSKTPGMIVPLLILLGAKRTIVKAAGGSQGDSTFKSTKPAPSSTTLPQKNSPGAKSGNSPSTVTAGKPQDGDHNKDAPKEPIGGFQEDEDLLHESLHQLVKDDKPQAKPVDEHHDTVRRC